jgi:hypothetical protein
MRDLRRSIIFPDENQGNLIGPRPRTAQRPEFANTARILFRMASHASDATVSGSFARRRPACSTGQLEGCYAVTLVRCSATSFIKPKRPS